MKAKLFTVLLFIAFTVSIIGCEQSIEKELTQSTITAPQGTSFGNTHDDPVVFHVGNKKHTYNSRLGSYHYKAYYETTSKYLAGHDMPLSTVTCSVHYPYAVKTENYIFVLVDYNSGTLGHENYYWTAIDKQTLRSVDAVHIGENIMVTKAEVLNRKTDTVSVTFVNRGQNWQYPENSTNVITYSISDKNGELQEKKVSQQPYTDDYDQLAGLKYLDVIGRKLKSAQGRTDNYYLDPAYHEKVFQTFCKGLSIEECVVFLNKHGIFTAAVLDDMSPAEAFRYTKKYAHVSPKYASQYAKQLVEKDPTTPEALEAILYLSFYATGSDPVKEESYYRLALKHHPDSVEALLGLGRLFYQKDPEKAIPYLTKAYQLKRDTGLLYLSITHERLGNYKSAWIYYRRIAQLGGSGMYHSLMEGLEEGTPLVEMKSVQSVLDRTAAEQSQHLEALKAFVKWGKAVLNDPQYAAGSDIASALRAHIFGGETTMTPEQLVNKYESM